MARTWRNPDPLVSTGNRIATRIAHRRVEGRRDLKKENLDGQKDLRGVVLWRKEDLKGSCRGQSREDPKIGFQGLKIS